MLASDFKVDIILYSFSLINSIICSVLSFEQETNFPSFNWIHEFILSVCSFIDNSNSYDSLLYIFKASSEQDNNLPSFNFNNLFIDPFFASIVLIHSIIYL
jgi:hypothetical protein